MDIWGYSERGALNALFYESTYTADPNATLAAILQEATFPFTTLQPVLGRAEILMEQSFSDFGDADAVLLIRGEPEETGSVVFIEAKVKTAQAGPWRIEEEFKNFEQGMESTIHSSNLFTQLYHKQRLVEALRTCDATLGPLQEGIPFPACSSKTRRKIGTNPVVLRATQRLQRYLSKGQSVYYLALVPDSAANIAAFCPKLHAAFHFSTLGPWNMSTFGYMTWEQVKACCATLNLKRTLDVLAYNEGQIC